MLHDELPRRRKVAAISFGAVMLGTYRRVRREDVRATAEAFVKAMADSDEEVTSHAKDGLVNIRLAWRPKETEIIALVNQTLKDG